MFKNRPDGTRAGNKTMKRTTTAQFANTTKVARDIVITVVIDDTHVC